MRYIKGETIRLLREKQGLTQKQLARQLAVSDKAVSKWETGRGLPDISLMQPLARELRVSVAELLSGEQVVNGNRAANMLRCRFYVCPLCGNVIHAMGAGVFNCCGLQLPPLEAERMEEGHTLLLEPVEDETFLTLAHPMEKDHYISFFAWVTADRLQLIKLYPEQNAQARLQMRGHGLLYAYCNQHGLFYTRR